VFLKKDPIIISEEELFRFGKFNISVRTVFNENVMRTR
jgi:hypothetical protein